MKTVRIVYPPALGLLTAVTLGCAGYAESVADMRRSLLNGNKAGALEHVNDALDVRDSEDYPKKLKGDNALLVL